jgi:hypothetical protein
MSEEEQSEVRAGGAGVGDPVELPSSIKVPEPPRQRRRYLERTPPEEGPEERYGQRFRSWARRHLLEITVFLVTTALLGGLAIFMTIQPGGSREGGVVFVGPSEDQDIPTYVQARRQALEDLASDRSSRVGVVTFAEPLPAERASGLPLPEAVVVEQAIVGDGFTLPETVGGAGSDPFEAAEAWRLQKIEIVETQVRNLDAAIAASPSPAPAAEWFDRERKRAGAALERLRSGRVVLGVIVSGPGSSLVSVQQLPDVLLVDVAPRGATVDRVSPRLARREAALS